MRALIFSAFLACSAAGFAYADMPGADWMPKEQIVEKLKGMGYTDIRKLEADDGHWEGDASKGGKVYEIHVDPHSGELTKNEPKDND